MTGLHQYSATPPQALSLPLRASSRAAAQALIWRRYGGVLAARYMDPYPDPSSGWCCGALAQRTHLCHPQRPGPDGDHP
ncbi:MAG: hypothetical protein WCK52_12290, partial [Betaproteobacteria bacterium]